MGETTQEGYHGVLIGLQFFIFIHPRTVEFFCVEEKFFRHTQKKGHSCEWFLQRQAALSI